MTGRRAVHPYAVVGGWAAYAIAKEVGARLEKLGEALLATGQREMGGELLEAVAQLRLIGRMRVEAHRAIAGSGNAAMPEASDGPASEPPMTGLKTGEVAALFGVKHRQARNLAEGNGGPLVATLVGGSWIFEEASVALELERRAAG